MGHAVPDTLQLAVLPKYTHVALAPGHFHGMLHIRGYSHIVVLGFALFLFKLLLVQFLWNIDVRS